MYSLERESSARDLIELASTTGHSRFPVTGEDADDIVGVVHLKRGIGVPVERRDQVPVSALMVEPVRVPENHGPGSIDNCNLGGRGAAVWKL